MNKKVKIVTIIIIVLVVFITSIDIITKGKITGLIGSVNPMNLQSKDVPYTNNSQSTVQGAIDDLYSKVSSCKKIKDNTIRYTKDPTIGYPYYEYIYLGRKVFLALNGDQKSVCINRNSRLHCFDNNNWEIEKDHVQTVFSDINCSANSRKVECYASDFTCIVSSNGNVYCNEADEYMCYVEPDGSADCEE